jgi:hypothetical protein
MRSPTNTLPAAQLVALRRYYKGVAAAQSGDLATALKLWQQVFAGGIFPAALLDNLGALLFQQLAEQIEAGDLEGAAAAVQQSIDMPVGGSALDELRVQALDQAQAAATVATGRARAAWENARRLVGASRRSARRATAAQPGAGLGPRSSGWKRPDLARYAAPERRPAAGRPVADRRAVGLGSQARDRLL